VGWSWPPQLPLWCWPCSFSVFQRQSVHHRHKHHYITCTWMGQSNCFTVCVCVAMFISCVLLLSNSVPYCTTGDARAGKGLQQGRQYYQWLRRQCHEVCCAIKLHILEGTFGLNLFSQLIHLQALEEESTMTPEQLALKNVGKQVSGARSSTPYDSRVVFVKWKNYEPANSITGSVRCYHRVGGLYA